MSDLLTAEVLAEIQRLRGRDPDIAGLLRHVAAMQAELDAADDLHQRTVESKIEIENHLRGIEQQVLNIEAFRQRAVAAVRSEVGSWPCRDQVIELLRQLPATEQPKEPHHARDRD